MTFTDDEREKIAARASGKVRPIGSAKPRTKPAPIVSDDHREVAAARMFVERFRDVVRHCAPIGSWYVWNGRAWERDELGRVREMAKTIADELRHAAAESNDDAAWKFARQIGSARGVSAVLALAQTDPAIVVPFRAFDAAQHLITCESGTVDLRTGEELPHNPEHMITRVAPCRYDAGAQHADLDRVLAHLVPDDDARRYLQRSIGYSLTAAMSEDVTFLLIGATRSGKGTLLAGIRGALGPYVGGARMQTFCAVKGNGNGGDKARSDLFRLFPKRIVYADEVSPGLEFDHGLLKSLAGGDVLPVRDLHKSEIEARWSATIFIVCNDGDLPAVRASDSALWERIKVIPIGGTVTAEERDATLRTRMETDADIRAAVFAWAVRGAVDWYAQGLGAAPASVTSATDALRTSVDHAAQWIGTNVRFAIGETTIKRELRKAYEAACEEAGEKPVSPRRLGQTLRSEGLRHGVHVDDGNKRDHDGKVCDAWKGVARV